MEKRLLDLINHLEELDSWDYDEVEQMLDELCQATGIEWAKDEHMISVDGNEYVFEDCQQLLDMIKEKAELKC